MRIFEGYFNNIEQDSDEITKEIEHQNIISDDNSLLPKYLICWKPSYGSSLIEISKNDINKLKTLIDNTRYAEDCTLMISGSNLYKKNPIAFNNIQDKAYVPIDFFKYQLTLDYSQIKNNNDYPLITVLHFFFNFSDSLKTNINYLLKILTELSYILKEFCIINNVPNDYLSNTNLCFTPGWEYFTDNSGSIRLRGCNNMISHFKINITSDLYKLKNGYANEDLYKEFSLFWTVVFNIHDKNRIFSNDELLKTLSYQLKCPKSLYNALIDCGITKKLISILEFSENKKTKTLDIIIPDNKTCCFNNVSLKSAMLLTKLTKIKLTIDGMLIIKDISEYSNLKLLKAGYKHNKLVINTIVTSKIIRRLLVSYDFKIIDFTNAEVVENVDIDMKYKLIMNPNIEIITDKNNMILLK